ncbi:hypothetical protein [Zooshikella harenae]|uniref:DUF4286 family protein n=1 Tax=Zooshikella harenae TaxID=2827238 RepID=A0ABS5ZL83_9GAMM|nr:hypothetical protein [Zooshikella harenae]MBU2714136.1 hypothetical protein [Zooshikella harenae]
MIFAEIKYDDHYEDFHVPLLKYVRNNFKHVDSGLQSDSWIWVYEEGNKVAIDTFSSVNHQIKSDKQDNPLIQKVISILQKKYNVIVYSEPELEYHEE